eukprot:Gregarina_sp_Pseudo_9__2376@NODE_2681_length_912_cov_145_525773_g2458_i0_p1_GENE_NODE_2681_length_912_cov_145_525773_g2458_i0NODE_2681_length_912_cov_145_525773_g2458_i0_p1_ORF_typecomplete_len210_score43_46_NODE_2681_length_912_cov_145_525773_g2458_i0111740
MSYTPGSHPTSVPGYVQSNVIPMTQTTTTGPTAGYHQIPTFTGSSFAPASFAPPARQFVSGPTSQLPPSAFYQQSVMPNVSITYPQAAVPQQPAPTTFITSGSVGHIIPAEQPYAFTTVTYAKQPIRPNHDEFKKAYARQTLQNLDDDHAPRIVKKQKGACGGFNECLCGCCDSNGGCCGCLNCGGCCDREQHVPVSIATVPRTSKGCC